jgi:HlyD family secretion protein
MKAKFTQAERDFARAKDLQRSPGAITGQDYDLYLANDESTKAAVAVGEATIAQTKRAVAQAEAVLKKAQTNLDYCTVKSPVKGVIVDRRVNVGQTVVSSLNAPSLFLIAKDLKRLQVWVSVNEADIGQIRAGQPVTFTVDAYPKDTFKGTVNKIRLNATMTNNVVTYTVEVTTDNSDGRLMPYLTANVQFEVGVHKNVLLVPNAAVQWRPQQAQIAPDARGDALDKSRKKGGKDNPDFGTAWIEDGQYVRPIKVRVGWTDGVHTEVQAEGLEPGTKVVVGDVHPTDNAGGSNPFAPKMFSGSGGGNKGGQ